MNAVTTPSAPSDAARILDRHARRRIAGVPTVSVLVGPVGACGKTWRRWAAIAGSSVIVAHRNRFPTPEWVCSVAEKVDLPAIAVQCLGRRAGRDPDSFLATWRATTVADRQRFQDTLVPQGDDDLLSVVATLAVDPAKSNAVAVELSQHGDRIVPLIVRLVPSVLWPGILFVAGDDDLCEIAAVAVQWVMAVPALPIAIVVPPDKWHRFRTSAPESRIKALLREGEVVLSGSGPMIDDGIAENTMIALASIEADPEVGAPASQAEDDGARSAAERFLFGFLESLPETAGRFELNGLLDFAFGSRPAEVDLLCRSSRIAIELDGYFHFLEADGYRRDRAKDWELQRRGYVVLRFLAEDVISHLEMVRDRILDALTTQGAPS